MSIYSGGPVGLQLRPASLDVLNPLGTTASFSSSCKARVHYVLARTCRLIAVYLLSFSYILTVPCVLSLINHCYIRLASPPLGPLKA